VRLSKQFDVKLQAALDSRFVVTQPTVTPQQQCPPPIHISEEMQVEETLFYGYEVRFYVTLVLLSYFSLIKFIKIHLESTYST
jgi:hypothetical protein